MSPEAQTDITRRVLQDATPGEMDDQHLHRLFLHGYRLPPPFLSAKRYRRLEMAV